MNGGASFWRQTRALTWPFWATNIMEMVERLADDHANARLLAQRLANIAGLEVDLDGVQSNILRFGLVKEGVTVQQVVAGCKAEGILFNAMDAAHFRAVTHYGIERDDVLYAASVIDRVLSGLPA